MTAQNFEPGFMLRGMNYGKLYIRSKMYTQIWAQIVSSAWYIYSWM